MEVILNGQPKELPAAISVTQLLELLELRTPGVAVEINGAIIPRPQQPQTLVQPVQIFFGEGTNNSRSLLTF